MMSSLVAVTLAASLVVGQTGGKQSKPKQNAAKPAAKIVKTGAMLKLEKDAGCTITVNDPSDGLVNVSITGAKATDAVMDEFVKIKGLDAVIVQKGLITDKGVAALTTATTLTTLRLIDCEKLTPACFKDIVKLPNLADLQMSIVAIESDELKALATKKSLRVLSLRSAGLTDADLAVFAGNTHIVSLGLFGNDGIKGRGLKSLHGMKQLQFVSVVGTHASARQITLLKKAVEDLGGTIEVNGKGGVLGLAKVKRSPPPPEDGN